VRRSRLGRRRRMSVVVCVPLTCEREVSV